MSLNKYQPHVFVIPEDDANRQIANGFLLDHPVRDRKIQVEPGAGGWRNVLEKFKTEHAPEMSKYVEQFTILLIDFDDDLSRINTAKAAIPANLSDRVFVLGTLSEPERLRVELGVSFETIGGLMAKECRGEGSETWTHPLLRHNAEELARLRTHVCPFLFSARKAAPQRLFAVQRSHLTSTCDKVL